ncbi:hypothetical protein FOYG_05354 [Fusarium oxysporum NRRL 32931]|uniref:Uncharacterized protein n=1 Tax=Fusarium oxysporum NRRL 32931 TaxID=660029 RepID=W9IW50_FUSOX|nr:hypothetical protein FOYG_05354 [Fusarium oxysporum NRRL 32931]EWY96762.1 hypothetical protein FOYG_05354 [Fusarium oxysporum NRRL 32931]
MPIQNQMMNDNEARPLRSCLSRHDASNLGDLRYSLLVKIDEDEANGMLLSIQTGLCYLWLYRVVSEVESGVLCHTRLPSPHQRGKNPLGRADQEKAIAAPVASRQPNPLDQWRRLYIMNSGTLSVQYSAEPFADMDNCEFDHYQEF